MGFEESARARLRRYRREADRSLETMRGIQDTAGRFSGRLFSGLEYAAVLGREAGFEIEVSSVGAVLYLRAAAGSDSGADVSFGLVRGAAAENDEDLMHEELSRYDLDPSGYSGRILGWSEAAGTGPCQVFAVYGDGVWKTKGLFVAKARGRVDDPDEVLNGFCLRILGRLIDVAALTGGAGRRWGDAGEYGLARFMDGEEGPTETRWPR